MYSYIHFVCPVCSERIKRLIKNSNDIWIPVAVYFKCKNCETNLQATYLIRMTPTGPDIFVSTPLEHTYSMPDIAFKKKEEKKENEISI